MVVSIVSKYQLWNDILIVWVRINEEMKEINTVKEHSQVILKEHSQIILAHPVII